MTAWLDGRGRIAYVTEAFTSTGDDSPDDFRWGAGYISVVDDPVVAERLSDLAPLWWGVGYEP